MDDESFREIGQFIYKNMQNGLALTAYTLITFLECSNKSFEATIEKALKFIETNLEKLHDDYALAIFTYALQLANHPLKHEMLSKLDERSLNYNDKKFWEKEKQEQTELS